MLLVKDWRRACWDILKVRGQATLFPDRLEDWVAEDNPVRVIDLFVEEIDIEQIGFPWTAPARTRRLGYHPSVLLKLFIYGYLNRVPSSRALEREAGRNVEVMWLTGRLDPDHKTIADFRRDNGPAVRRTCVQFVQALEPSALSDLLKLAGVIPVSFLKARVKAESEA